MDIVLNGTLTVSRIHISEYRGVSTVSVSYMPNPWYTDPLETEAKREEIVLEEGTDTDPASASEDSSWNEEILVNPKTKFTGEADEHETGEAGDVVERESDIGLSEIDMDEKVPEVPGVDLTEPVDKFGDAVEVSKNGVPDEENDPDLAEGILADVVAKVRSKTGSGISVPEEEIGPDV